jgi:hypothetical protein
MRISKNTPKKQINEDIFIEAEMVDFKTATGYESRQGYENVIIAENKIVNVVSNSYGFISNQNFFRNFEGILMDEGINFQAKYKNVENQQFVADYILDGEQKVGTYKGTDLIQPKIRLQNSYDGKLLLSGYFGFFRQVCSNGLHTHKNELAFKIKRTQNNLLATPDKLVQMLDEYRNNTMIEIKSIFDELSKVELTDLNKAVRELSEKVDILTFANKKDIPTEKAVAVIDTIRRESNELKTKPNAWLLYNAFNELLYNDELNFKNEGMRKDLDMKLFAEVQGSYLN